MIKHKCHHEDVKHFSIKGANNFLRVNCKILWSDVRRRDILSILYVSFHCELFLLTGRSFQHTLVPLQIYFSKVWSSRIMYHDKTGNSQFYKGCEFEERTFKFLIKTKTIYNFSTRCLNCFTFFMNFCKNFVKTFKRVTSFEQ